ncbi:MAG TPA: M13 family metallopeptidase [Chthoniobacterales bacterium]|nr:M13 family metallopeptidase [Chthoniobacterales bacterium]
MLKFSPLLLASCFYAFTLHAQSEPNATVSGKSTPPPSVKQPPSGKSVDKIPPPVATPMPGQPVTTAGDAGKPKIEKDPPAFDINHMDTSVNPAEDFYTYAIGGWLKQNPIPPEFSRWGSFNELAEKNNEAMRIAAEMAAKAKTDPKLAPEVQKVGDFYSTGMDEKAVEAAKAKPLEEELKRIDSIKNDGDVLQGIARLHMMGASALFGFTSGADDKNASMVIAQAYQGGLGLPDRDYYTKEDEGSKKLRDGYVEHVGKMLTLLGDPPAKASESAQKVMAIETALAKPARTRVELRNPEANYNKMSQADLQALMPDFKWADYFKAIGLTEPGDINVGQPDFFKAANGVFTSTPVDDWKTYLRWHLVKNMASELSTDFVNEEFRFFGQTLTGAKKLKERWKRVVEATDAHVGEALGKLYVADNFPPESKARMLVLVENVQEAMADSIKSRDWMDDVTKQEALKKLAAFTVKIGYPDKWRDYSTLRIDRTSFAGNAMRAALFETERQLKKIGKPVDRSEWGMTPPTVNAYYNPNLNEIVFPAGILQPPFFNAKADDAINYGGIGAVIAHEISHGFDDQGRQFDAQGNLRDWWTPESAARYKERADRIVQQYDEYEPLPAQKINGRLTLGENIADDGGVKLAYAALQKALDKSGKREKIDGFTPEQRFFLGWAQIWRSNTREEEIKRRLIMDTHSPGKYRCNGPLSNTPEFQKAFNIPDGAPMIRPPEKIVSIW